jgi:hypothetical protein
VIPDSGALLGLLGAGDHKQGNPPWEAEEGAPGRREGIYVGLRVA